MAPVNYMIITETKTTVGVWNRKALNLKKITNNQKNNLITLNFSYLLMQSTLIRFQSLKIVQWNQVNKC